MKKVFSIICVIAMAVMLLAACGQSGNSGNNGGASGDFDITKVKTLADVFPYVGEDYQEGWTDEQYSIVFGINDVYYRAIADMPKDVADAVWKIEFDDEKREEKVRELVSALETVPENLTEKIPQQEELDKLVGKTGQELFDAGWTYWYYDLESMDAGMEHEGFSYNVKFDYDGEQMKNDDDFDFYEEFKDLKVSEITFEGLGDALGI